MTGMQQKDETGADDQVVTVTVRNLNAFESAVRGMAEASIRVERARLKLEAAKNNLDRELEAEAAAMRADAKATALPCSKFDPEPSEEAKQLRALEEVGAYLDNLVEAVAARHGVVGVRQLIVSEELGRRLGVTPGAPASVRTQCGLVKVVAAREKTAARR